MKLAIAMLLNVFLSVGAMCFLLVMGVNFWISFLIFLAAFIPSVNYLVTKFTGIDVQKKVFK